MMDYSLLYKGQSALLVLASAFVIGGLFKRTNMFASLFALVSTRMQSKRLSLFLVSLVSGVLPIEGRVSVSAPVLDTLVGKCSCPRGRSKMGILDFVATHHYYLWSPLEKSVIITMAGLGLTYTQFLSYTIVPIGVYIMFLAYIVLVYVKEEEIVLPEIDEIEEPYAGDNGLLFFIGLVYCIMFEPYVVFPIVAILYCFLLGITFKEMLGFIRIKPLLFLAALIIAANVFKAHSAEISALMDPSNFYGPAWLVPVIAISGGALTSFILGSSSKYAGITVALTLLLGMEYFPIILMAEYVGYLLSPTHKCLAISMLYFKTRITEFYKYISLLAALMLTCGVSGFIARSLT
jgi:hypothetical protein